MGSKAMTPDERLECEGIVDLANRQYPDRDFSICRDDGGWTVSYASLAPDKEGDPDVSAFGKTPWEGLGRLLGEHEIMRMLRQLPPNTQEKAA